MSYSQRELQAAERHLMQAELNVADQKTIISRLRNAGYPIAQSLEVLTDLERTVQQMRQTRDRIRSELEYRPSGLPVE
jgi:NAD-dependent DNA ligase